MAVLLDWDWPYRHFLGRIHITARWLGVGSAFHPHPLLKPIPISRSHPPNGGVLGLCAGHEAPAPKYRFWMRPLHLVVMALVWTREEGPIFGRGGLSLRFW